MIKQMGHLAAKSIVEDYFDTLPDIESGLKIPKSPAFTSIQSLLRQNAHKKKLPPRIKANLEKRFRIGLKLSVETWNKNEKVLSGHTPCSAKRWPIVDEDKNVMFDEPSVVLFYIGAITFGTGANNYTRVTYKVFASVGQHALVRMLERNASTAEGMADTASEALHMAARLSHFAWKHSIITKSKFWRSTHTIALPFKGGALILVNHPLADTFANFDKRNYSVRTWLLPDQLSDDVRHSMKGWHELIEAEQFDDRPDYLDRLFLPKDFAYD